ncbi:C39 family peptidase [Ammoniphilus sp. YIM 78166]|uniref:C39 family peptidase n=1 Tax=Ammoniphilus sp. YIM 78166 TaxID=1644106 RepID=UPI00106FB02F|nr:C39 family peptidase [Ammoniphilus sp. YIM 78166]
MKKLSITTIALLIGFFLFQETTVSPVVKIQAQTAAETAQQATQKLLGVASAPSLTASAVLAQRPPAALLEAPAVRQLPELYNGCEVSSLAMLLAAAGHSVDKMELSDRLVKDPTPYIGKSLQQIQQWGDPNLGFVGDITGKKKGYGVYNGPLFDLLVTYVSEGAENLTGKNFDTLEWVLSQGHPIVVWTTVSFQPTDRWVTWKNNDQEIRATFQMHAVLLVGYDDQHVYINDPLTGSKGQKLNKSAFIKSWEQLGKQAITIMEEHPHWYVLR